MNYAVRGASRGMLLAGTSIQENPTHATCTTPRHRAASRAVPNSGHRALRTGLSGDTALRGRANGDVGRSEERLPAVQGRRLVAFKWWKCSACLKWNWTASQLSCPRCKRMGLGTALVM